MAEMKFHNESSFLKPDAIAKVENTYNAKYIFESCLKTKDGNWSNFPVAIFYTEQAHPEGSNYFGIFRNDFGALTIANGISATEPFEGIQIDEDVYYSRYRHDFRDCKKGISIDGGRDYTRLVGNVLTGSHKNVKITVVKDKLEVIDE